jgi:hypothetical protein
MMALFCYESIVMMNMNTRFYEVCKVCVDLVAGAVKDVILRHIHNRMVHQLWSSHLSW